MRLRAGHLHGLVLIAITTVGGGASAQSNGHGAFQLGGSDRDAVFGVARDPAGNVYVVGETYSADFPVVGGLQGTRSGIADAFVAKLGPNGQLVYSTYLGGSGFDSGRAIALGADGSVWVAGYTESVNFPLQAPLDANRSGFSDAFIARLDAEGDALQFSTYFGGGDADNADAIALDGGGNVYVAGRTRGGLQPINAAQTQFGGVEDAFVLKLVPAPAAYAYVTYLGGSQLEFSRALAVDAVGRACVAGLTQSPDFPPVNASQPGPATGTTNAFYALLQASGSAFVVSSTLGGSGFEEARGVDCDATRIAVVGDTSSVDFPTGSDSGATLQASVGGDRDGFLAVFDATNGTRRLATYVGGRRDDGMAGVSFGDDGSLVMLGDSKSMDLPGPLGPVHPAAASGIHRSTDGGATWTPTSLGRATINDLVRAPAPQPRVLAATDAGLFTSADGGIAWQRSTAALARRVVHAIAVSPADPCTWLIGVDTDAAADGATPAGAARSIDCGANWSAWGPPAFRFRALRWLSDPDRVLAVVERAPGFSGGSANDTCVYDAGGVQRRCLGRGTADTLIAVDPSDPCRWYEAYPSGAVVRMSGNSFGCDHPFGQANAGANLGAPVTALAVLPVPLASSLASAEAAGSPQGPSAVFRPIVGYRGYAAILGEDNAWDELDVGAPLSAPATAFVRSADPNVFGLASAVEMRACSHDTLACTRLAGDTGVAPFGQLLDTGQELLGGTLPLRAVYAIARPSSLALEVGIECVAYRCDQERTSAFAATGASPPGVAYGAQASGSCGAPRRDGFPIAAYGPPESGQIGLGLKWYAEDATRDPLLGLETVQRDGFESLVARGCEITATYWFD